MTKLWYLGWSWYCDSAQEIVHLIKSVTKKVKEEETEVQGLGSIWKQAVENILSQHWGGGEGREEITKNKCFIVGV